MAPTMWGVFEGNLGILVASLPALRQFFMVTREDLSSLRSKLSGSKASSSRVNEKSTTSAEVLRPSTGKGGWRSLDGEESDDIELMAHAVHVK